MNIALFGVSGDFDISRGESLQRYMYELYTNLKKLNVNVVKEIPNPYLPMSKNGLSQLLYFVFKDLNKYDIIHSLDFRPVLPLRKGRAELVSTINDLIPILHPEFNTDYKSKVKDILWLELVTKLGLKMQLRVSDYIIAISTMVKEEIIHTGFPKSKAFVVNDGIDVRFISDRKHPKAVNDPYTVGYLGNLVYRKNVSFAIDSFRHINSKNIAFKIWGNKNRGFETLSRMTQYDKRISFMGKANETDLVGTYDTFDIFVFPSLYEGFGLPILEAQARELPVIIYKNAKIPSEVRKYCFEAEDPTHMAEIISNLKENGYNQKLQKKATEYARSFTWERTAKDTLSVYKKLLML